MPSFAILIIIGYLFATTSRLEGVNLSNLVPLSVLSLLCIVLSALSAFYFIAFIGGFLALTVLIRAFTKPAFKTLSRRGPFFLVEMGAMFVASFSLLSILMWLISEFFPTYAIGSYVGYSPQALLWVGVLSFLTFFVILLIDSRGKNPVVCGAFGLITSILSLTFVLQNQYVLANPTAYISMFMLVLGYILALTGDLIYVSLFFLQRAASATIPIPSLLYYGKYCPYCGKPRARSVPPQIFCYHCRRSLMWTPYAPFCSSCGLLVPTNAEACPHCQENIKNKRTYFHRKDAKEQSVVDRLIAKSTKKKTWVTKGLARMSQELQPVRLALPSVNRFFNLLIERLSTLPDVVGILFVAGLSSFFFLLVVRILFLRIVM